jgi:hypothetical protein
MLLASAPVKIVEAFADGGSKNTIPVVSTGVPGSASWTVGFPPETMLDPADGGIGPSGLDFNGIYNQISALSLWFSAGGSFKYDAAFSAAVGGYPAGARVLQAGGFGYWLSVVDNNLTNPDAGGAGWIPQGSNVVSSVFASTQQTLAPGNTKILYDTVEFDSGGLWDAVNKRYVAKWPGMYRLSGATELEAPGSQNFTADIYKNGAFAKRCFEYPQVSDVNITVPFNVIIQLNAGDFVEAFMIVSQTSVLAGQVGSNQPFVYSQLEYLGQ